jgi:hypothetical protein
MAKKPSTKLSDSEQVELYMKTLSTHPLLAEVEALRGILKKSSAKLNERIKWNAPSYYYKEDIVTFGPRKENKVLLVFHHPYIVKIKSELLEGDYKDRRLAWFSNMKEIKSNKKNLTNIMKLLVEAIDKKNKA